MTERLACMLDYCEHLHLPSHKMSLSSARSTCSRERQRIGGEACTRARTRDQRKRRARILDVEPVLLIAGRGTVEDWVAVLLAILRGGHDLGARRERPLRCPLEGA